MLWGLFILRPLIKTIVNSSKWIVIPSLAYGLISCQAQPQRNVDPTPASLPYKVDGAADSHRVEMQKRLENHGIKVVTMGQNYLISIPSSVLFANQSPRIKWDCYGIFNDIVCYLKQFQKIAVTVNSYTGKCISPERDRALTMARSRVVADYLWLQDIDSRFIFTDGLGSDKPIVAFGQQGDASLNSRIEITFQDAVA